MQITGQIQNVQPHFKDGQPETFTTGNGTFYVFDMSVNGTIGTINSKSPQYPKSQGQEISINVTQDQYGNNKFKAFNPQYANQQQPQQQQPQQQGMSNFLPKPPQPEVNKERLIATEVVYKCLMDMPNPINANFENDLKAGVDMIFRVAENLPAPKVQGHPQEQMQQPPQQPQYGVNPNDDIPF